MDLPFQHWPGGCLQFAALIQSRQCATFRSDLQRLRLGKGNMKPESWVSLEEIAEHLKVSTDTVHRWIRARRIPVNRVGRFWRFRVSEVDAWVVAGEAGTGRDVRDGETNRRRKN